MHGGLRFTLVVFLAVLGFVSWPLLAGTSSDSSGTFSHEWQAVCKAYGLRTVTYLPAGVKPLAVDTPQQLRNLLQATADLLSGTRTSFVVETHSDLHTLSLTETYVSLHKSKIIDSIMRTRFNLWADVWVAGSGSFWEITDVAEWVGLSGFTLWWSLSNPWHYHHISSNKQRVTIRGGGTANQYLLIQGIIKIYSFPVSLKINYRI